MLHKFYIVLPLMNAVGSGIAWFGDSNESIWEKALTTSRVVDGRRNGPQCGPYDIKYESIDLVQIESSIRLNESEHIPNLLMAGLEEEVAVGAVAFGS